MRRLVYTISIVLYLFIVYVFPVNAQEKSSFSTSIKSTYKISERLDPRVTHEVSIINETREDFIQAFTLSVNSQTLKDVVAASPSEPAIPVNVSKDGTSSVIVLKFSKPVLGLGKSSSFTLSYSDPSIFNQTGLIKEVQIPPFDHGLPITTHTVTLEVPPSFEALSRSYPNPSRLSTLENTTSYQFNYSGVGSSAIYLLFGSMQQYDLLLRYHLENPTITPVYAQVVLAPDTAYQKVFYESIKPKPDDVTRDEDGNWIASYTLEPKTTKSIVAKGFVEVADKPSAQYVSQDTNFQIYTQKKPYWSAQAPQNIGSGFVEAKDIYNYVVEKLDYDYNRLSENVPERLGSERALANPESSLCFEFTDTFIALARSAGIPARAVMGFAQTSNQALRPLSANQEALHAWPEYYDFQEKQWRWIDPTWQKTTGGVDYFDHFDFNHVALSILGHESDSPLPAGYYKQGGVPTKDVYIQVSKNPQKLQSIIAIKPEYSLAYQLGLTNMIHFILTLDAGGALYEQTLTLNNQQGRASSMVVPYLLPFSSQRVTIPVEAQGWNSTLDSNISYENYTSTTTINNPRFRRAILFALSIALGFSATIVIAYRTRRILV